MKRLSVLAASAAAVWLLGLAVARSQDEVNPQVRETEPVLIDDLSPEVKARAEAEARERAAEDAALSAVPDSLEAALGAALANNPDILLAGAKLRQAEAELNQVRLKTVQEVLVAYKQYESQKEMVARVEQLAASNEIGSKEVLQMQQNLVQIEAQLRYLLGTPAQGMAPPAGGAPPAAALPGERTERVVRESPVRPNLPEDLENALSAEVLCDFVDAPLSEILAYLKDQTGISVLVGDHNYEETSLTLTLGTTSWRNVLVALSDIYGYCFVVRDYGMLTTGRDQAEGLFGAAIPADLPYREGGGGFGGGGGGF